MNQKYYSTCHGKYTNSIMKTYNYHVYLIIVTFSYSLVYFQGHFKTSVIQLLLLVI